MTEIQRRQGVPAFDERFVVPLVPMPISPRLHENVESARVAMWAWLEHFNLVPETSRVHVQRICAERVTCWMQPNARTEQIEFLAQWMVWLFIIDDQFDDYGGKNLTRWDRQAAETMAALDGVRPSRRDPVATALWDLLDRTFAIRSAYWRERFVWNLRRYVLAFRAETALRGQRQLPTVNDFLRHRLESVASEAWLDLTEIGAEVDLPLEVHACPDFQVARTATCYSLALINDLYSLRKEIGYGYTFNTVTLVAAERRVSMQRAVDYVVGLHAQAMDDFRSAEDRLRAELPDAHRRAALRAIHGYASVCTGNQAWSMEVPRYAQPNATPLPMDNIMGCE